MIGLVDCFVDTFALRVGFGRVVKEVRYKRGVL